MRSERWPTLAVFVAALALRLLHVQQVVAHDPFYDQPSVDSLVYSDWAKRIAAGDWLGSEPFFLSPLYGYFLGALYARVRPELPRAARRERAVRRGHLRAGLRHRVSALRPPSRRCRRGALRAVPDGDLLRGRGAARGAADPGHDGGGVERAAGARRADTGALRARGRAARAGGARARERDPLRACIRGVGVVRAARPRVPPRGAPRSPARIWARRARRPAGDLVQLGRRARPRAGELDRRHRALHRLEPRGERRLRGAEHLSARARRRPGRAEERLSRRRGGARGPASCARRRCRATGAARRSTGSARIRARRSRSASRRRGCSGTRSRRGTSARSRSRAAMSWVLRRRVRRRSGSSRRSRSPVSRSRPRAGGSWCRSTS